MYSKIAALLGLKLYQRFSIGSLPNIYCFTPYELKVTNTNNGLPIISAQTMNRILSGREVITPLPAREEVSP